LPWSFAHAPLEQRTHFPAPGAKRAGILGEDFQIAPGVAGEPSSDAGRFGGDRGGIDAGHRGWHRHGPYFHLRIVSASRQEGDEQ
jgi:hypothetical protein